jgi:peptide-methionine (R)-S-oxide reductase
MSKYYKMMKNGKSLLDDESFRVTRQSGTERPFTGKYWDFNKDGIYKCICCGLKIYLNLILNLMQVADGQVFLYLK